MADHNAMPAEGLSLLMLGNSDLESEADTSYVRPAPLSPPEDDPLLALDHAAALRAIAPPQAPEPLA